MVIFFVVSVCKIGAILLMEIICSINLDYSIDIMKKNDII